MRSILILLALLTGTLGCVVEDRPVNPTDGGPDGSVCGECTDEAPVCDEVKEQCVECSVERQEELCGGATRFCSPDGDCVACVDDSACMNPNAARCDQTSYECDECDDNRQCDDVTGFPGTANACFMGACVDCTPESEDTTCPSDPRGFSCDPTTNTCTTTEVGSRSVCETCITDSECGDDDGMPSDAHRCVEMFYPDMETRFPDEETGFCLKIFEPGGCEQPYAIRISNRASFSDDTVRDWCGINESLATCPAVRALDTTQPCPDGQDEQCPESGLCRDVGGFADICTYRCTDETQCDSVPNPGSTCGASGGGGEDYCGG